MKIAFRSSSNASRALVVQMVCALSLVGCGGDDGDSAGMGGAATGSGGRSASNGSGLFSGASGQGGGSSASGGKNSAGATSKGGASSGGATSTGGKSSGGTPGKGGTGGMAVDCSRSAVASCTTPSVDGGLSICTEAYDAGLPAETISSNCAGGMLTQGNCASSGRYVGAGGISTFYYTSDLNMAAGLKTACTAISGYWCDP